ncbi:hypothetical protein VTN00DRAFT_2707 [Thermoascus crustaceus]|uniref:uncharacterized protein n=1 Tax=Thermoascus crustaceus TaxID=5088 RepID=UPI003743783A
MAASNSYSNPESLAVLSAMVNQTLIDTGRFFRSSGSMQSRTQLKRAIPSAHEQFQMALDSLSEQIFIAKAFLEKDYEAIKAKKAVAPPPEPTVAPNEPQPAEDVTMEEASAAFEAETAQNSAEKAETLIDTKQPKVKAEDEHATAEASATATAAPNEAVKNVKAENQDTAAAVGGNQPFSGAGEEMNFDSMLPDTSGGANAFDLNLDFGNDEIGNQNFLSGANFLDSGNSGTNEQGKDQGGSISSLLPGLESYAANAVGDDFNVELQQVGNDTSQQQQQPQQHQAQQQQQQQGQQREQQQQSEAQKDKGPEEVIAPGESSFDDLFMEGDNFGGEGDDSMLGGDGLMDIGELDDAWFS